jgi:tetratricopeptide (TPR) repeat protein
MTVSYDVRSWWFVCGLLLLQWSFGGLAHAQDDKARARELFGAGVTHFEAGEYSAALEAFQGAYRLAPHPTVRINMANCYERLNSPVEAVFNFQRFLEEAGPSVDPAQREEVERTVARLEASIGTLQIDVLPPDAQIRIDGKVPRRLPSGLIQLGAGRYQLSVTAPGYVAVERDVLISGGQQERVQVALERDQPAVAVAESDEDAVLEQPIAESEQPAPIADELENEAPPMVEEESAAKAGKGRPWLWVAAGSTIALAVGFAVTGGLAVKAQNEFDSAVERSNDSQVSATERTAARADGLDAADRADSLSITSDVLLATAAVAGGATLLIWLTGKKREDRLALQASPMLSRSAAGAGLALRGKF